jgi:RHS repeat-associated protein
MKRKLLHSLQALFTQFTSGLCALAMLLSGWPVFPRASHAAAASLPTAKQTPSPAEKNPSPPIKVNRTVPAVTPPKTTLEFSVNPTPEEIFRSHAFEEPLVPIGGDPTRAENAALASALLGYAKRSGPDDFLSLTRFLEAHPKSPWTAALLLDLGLEYYNTARYSLALDAWAKAWALSKDATDLRGKVIGDRSAGELASMYAKVGRMTDLEVLFNEVEGRVFGGPATEKISGARAGLSNMKERPEVAFRCGPLALHRIKVSQNPTNAADVTICKTASTQQGFSLPQVAELSQKVGLNYQMAFREKGAFVVPSVIHWKVGHYAAVIRQEGDRFLLQDPTFRNDIWATAETLDAESSGYFLLPPGTLPPGWRAVPADEGGKVWGKGNTDDNDPHRFGCNDEKSSGGSCRDKPNCPRFGGGGGGGPGPGGMAVPSVHLMLVSLNIEDEPVGYSPPVGPDVRFTLRYNQRDSFQPASFTYANFGPKWTYDWVSYIKDSPFSPSADVEYYAVGGGVNTFTGFDPATSSFAHQQFDQTRLSRIAPDRYEMVFPQGSKLVFGQSDGSLGSTRKVFLSQIVDPFGNAVSLTYDANFRLVAITDAIGQVTTLTYQHAPDMYKITKVTDPFGRFATFAYDSSGRLTNITDVIGLTSRFTYEGPGDFVNSLITPYGVTTFTKGESGRTRWLETVYPDGERDRVEYNQTIGTIPNAEQAQNVPGGMSVRNEFLDLRNTYYWSKIACAQAYGDYRKAKVYHWLHTADFTSTAGILESVKEPLENRVWYDYAGQSSPIIVGSTDRPTHVGRVLDDNSTQLYTYEYNGFGKMTKTIDPVGREFSYLYSTNGIDLLEIRQTRAGNNELLSRTTYNAQHLHLTVTDAAGQTTTNTYNARGQILTETDPRGAVTTFHYDTNGYRTSVDGPLPGTGDTTTWTYDSVGRVRTKTDESGYTLTFDHDVLDRLTKVTFPDSTYDEYTFTRLDLSQLQDRAGRITTFEHNGIAQMTKRTDPLGRVTRFQWCKCGDSKSITDPMGRTTTWSHDVQGRMIAKTYADGSKISYKYENTMGRLRERIDEQSQVTRYAYNNDNTLSGVSYANAVAPTPSVTFGFDSNYPRPTVMTDGTGTTRYEYFPITDPPGLGAGQLATVDGPLPNDTISYAYNQTGRRVSTAINGISSAVGLDISGRITSVTNALGVFNYTYEGDSLRLASEAYPNGQTTEFSYGSLLQDQLLQRITHRVGAVPASEFIYGWNVAAGRIASWSQQIGADVLSVYNFAYDPVDQLTGSIVTQSGSTNQVLGYGYDASGNRLFDALNDSTNQFSYNALNELTTRSGGVPSSSAYQWDAEHRLRSVTLGATNTKFSYDGLGRRVGIRVLTNGVEMAHRLYVWDDLQICQERDTNGVVTKRFFGQGMKVEFGPVTGSFFYVKDHQGSIRQLTDAGGDIRAIYAYDPFGRRTRVFGDLEADFGFTGMLWLAESGLYLTMFRAYNANNGRWLSRDPVANAEVSEGINLFAYVFNNPINNVDSLGLKKECCKQEYDAWMNQLDEASRVCRLAQEHAFDGCTGVPGVPGGVGMAVGTALTVFGLGVAGAYSAAAGAGLYLGTCLGGIDIAFHLCNVELLDALRHQKWYRDCMEKKCPNAPLCPPR